ncbi:S1/P1 nuclease [Lentiprolixibacter aurantiacus]|uniref:S1/P1 nuclease n=1 Tax=Lentiprolixibacter aurantiacus TaxID=2993939 RepID=A0AAE3MLR8_9FLAO|nr:S1/P1 nuclease [Lentiprolixibacter aurantiacus]MCX2720175.1 S1/P1 nuclease [Lentiprolixibacter aurantiacus]
MKRILILLLLSASMAYGNADIWGKTGHRVVGEVAQKYLTGKAKRKIRKLLKGQTLAEVANYADAIRSDRVYDRFMTWHYVNFEPDQEYRNAKHNPDGDVVMGILRCKAILEDETRSEADHIFYLKMLVHLVGDLHQPMHAGRAGDRGGNDIQIQWFGRGSNLHRLWDTNMISDYGMSYTELTKRVDKLSRTERMELAQGDVYSWVEESQDIANEIYDSVEVGEKLGYSYSYKYWQTVEQQLVKGGVRLAEVLNDIFD